MSRRFDRRSETAAMSVRKGSLALGWGARATCSETRGVGPVRIESGIRRSIRAPAYAAPTDSRKSFHCCGFGATSRATRPGKLHGGRVKIGRRCGSAAFRPGTGIHRECVRGDFRPRVSNFDPKPNEGCCEVAKSLRSTRIRDAQEKYAKSWNAAKVFVRLVMRVEGEISPLGPAFRDR